MPTFTLCAVGDELRRQQLAAEAKAGQAVLLRGVVELPLPATEERPAQPIAQASGARKRKREPDPTELSQDQLLAILDRRVLVAEKTVKRGLSALASTKKQEAEAQSKAEWHLARFERHKGTGKLHEKVKIAKELWEATSHVVMAAEADLLEAQMRF